MKRFAWLVVMALVVAGPGSAVSITTLFASDNRNNIGGTNLFDVNVLNPGGLQIQQLEVNTSASSGTPISLDVYRKAGTYVGSEANAGVWNLVASGNGTAAGTNNPTAVDITDFNLGPGVSGILIHNKDYQAEYTNGTGGNQFYSNADLSLTMGAATNVLHTAPAFTPRVWNGTIIYDPTPIPEASTFALFGLSALGLMVWRKRKK